MAAENPSAASLHVINLFEKKIGTLIKPLTGNDSFRSNTTFCGFSLLYFIMLCAWGLMTQLLN